MSLIYVNPVTKQETSMSDGSCILVSEYENNSFMITVMKENTIQESYHAHNKEKAAIYITALILGFQPPRLLESQDKPVD